MDENLFKKNSKIGDLIKKAELDIKAKHKGLLKSIAMFENAKHFECEE
jgi:hypothetical protein